MVNRFILECQWTITRSTKHCQTDFQPGETHEHEIINQQQTQSTVTKGNHT